MNACLISLPCHPSVSAALVWGVVLWSGCMGGLHAQPVAGPTLGGFFEQGPLAGFHPGRQREALASIQSQLRWLGAYGGVVDGSPDAALSPSLSGWQQQHGIEENGRIGPKTAEAFGLSDFRDVVPKWNVFIGRWQTHQIPPDKDGRVTGNKIDEHSHVFEFVIAPDSVPVLKEFKKVDETQLGDDFQRERDTYDLPSKGFSEDTIKGDKWGGSYKGTLIERKVKSCVTTYDQTLHCLLVTIEFTAAKIIKNPSGKVSLNPGGKKEVTEQYAFIHDSQRDIIVWKSFKPWAAAKSDFDKTLQDALKSIEDQKKEPKETFDGYFERVKAPVMPVKP